MSKEAQERFFAVLGSTMKVGMDPKTALIFAAEAYAKGIGVMEEDVFGTEVSENVSDSQ